MVRDALLYVVILVAVAIACGLPLFVGRAPPTAAAGPAAELVAANPLHATRDDVVECVDMVRMMTRQNAHLIGSR
jgi:hypothetical protein